MRTARAVRVWQQHRGRADADRPRVGRCVRFFPFLALHILIVSFWPALAAEERSREFPTVGDPCRCFAATPDQRTIDQYDLAPGTALFIHTNAGSPMLLQISVAESRMEARVFSNCGTFTFSDSVRNAKNGIAFQEWRDWGGCRLVVANVTAASPRTVIRVMLVGQ